MVTNAPEAQGRVISFAATFFADAGRAYPGAHGWALPPLDRRELQAEQVVVGSVTMRVPFNQLEHLPLQGLGVGVPEP